MDPVRVLSLATSQGTISAQVLVLGCEPQDFGDELEGRMGLSSPVQAAVEEACNMVMQLAARIVSTKTSKLETVEEVRA
jgi:hydrogenase maturation protease